MKLTLDTPIIEFHNYRVSKLSAAMARKLAIAVAGESAKSDLTEATVEDLLNYFPMRYEDRSNLLQIDQLYDGIEASVELYARVSGRISSWKEPRAEGSSAFHLRDLGQ